MKTRSSEVHSGGSASRAGTGSSVERLALRPDILAEDNHPKNGQMNAEISELIGNQEVNRIRSIGPNGNDYW